MDWQPIDTAPEGVPIMIGHKGERWVATGTYTRVPEDEAARFGSFATVLHYNGAKLVGLFYATHWAPLPDAP